MGHAQKQRGIHATRKADQGRFMRGNEIAQRLVFL
jgi:hypothetical protein